MTREDATTLRLASAMLTSHAKWKDGAKVVAGDLTAMAERMDDALDRVLFPTAELPPQGLPCA